MPTSMILAWTVLGFGPLQVQVDEKLMEFDHRQLELRRAGDHWEVWTGGKLLKDLGSSEADAREALALIRQLRLCKHGTIGTPRPVMEYWLGDQGAPQGIIPANRLTAIDRQSLRAEQLHGQWCVRDARQLFFNFGNHEADARAAVQVIQRYQLGRIGYVGHPVPVMIYFMGGLAMEQARPAGSPAGGGVILPLQLLHVRQLNPPNPFLFDAAAGEDRLNLDWRRVELRRDGFNWKLVVPGRCLADFGPDEYSAREALRAIQYYRFTEQCRIGNSATSVMYFLVNGQAPRGLKLGLQSTPFRPENLSVRKVQDQWLLYEGERPILRGGRTEEEAKQVLKAIQLHKFDHLCRIGNAENASLQFLVKER
jgi:hypothetical protein